MDGDIIDVTEATFDAEVVQHSHTRPVLVDFWAPWCGPCRALGPVLERVNRDSQGGFRLAKLNTDENQAISQAHNIRGIPAVFAYVGGEVKDGFTGALPEPQVRAFLDKVVPKKSAAATGEAQAALDAGDAAGALAAAERALAEDPSDRRALLIKGRALCAQPDVEGAQAVLDQLTADRDVSSADIDALSARVALLGYAQNGTRLASAAQAALEGKIAEAFEQARAAMSTPKSAGGDKEGGHSLAKAVINLCEDEDQKRDMRRALASLLF